MKGGFYGACDMKKIYSTEAVILTLLATTVSMSEKTNDAEIVVRNDELLEKLVEQWRYTNYAEDVGGGRTGSIRTSVQQCKDSFGVVWQHYADKCGYDVEFGKKKFYRLGRESNRVVYLLDDRIKFTKEQGRRIRTFFICNGPNYSVTVIVLPQEGRTVAAADGSVSETPTLVLMTITVR